MKYNVLSVDELAITRIELSSMLKNHNVQVTGARDKFEALNVLHNGVTNINAIIWTVNSTECNEFEDIRDIKKRETYKHIPVIIISKHTGKNYIIKAIEAGAIEYIAKPYDANTIANKINKVLGIPQEKVSDEVDDDIITFNFSEMLNREIKAASRGGYSLTLMLVSVVSENSNEEILYDEMELINTVSRVMKTKLRDTDTIFLYGNNSMIALLPFTDNEGAKVVESRINSTFASHTVIKQKNKGYKLVIGSATFPEHGKVRNKLLEYVKASFNNNLKSDKNCLA